MAHEQNCGSVDIGDSPPTSPFNIAGYGDDDDISMQLDSPPTSPGNQNAESIQLTDSDDAAVLSDASNTSSRKTSLNSPSSSPLRNVRKRPAYSVYKLDPSHPVPKETLRRWKLQKLQEDDQGNDKHPDEDKSSVNESGVMQSACGSNQPCLLPSMEDNVVPWSIAGSRPSSPLVTNAQAGFNSSDSEPASSHNESGSNISLPNSAFDDTLSVQYSDDMECVVSDSESDINDSDNFEDDENILYPGSEKSKNLAVLQLLEIHLKNKTSKTTLTDFLKFYVSSLPAGHNMPRSVHRLMAYVEKFAIPVKEVKHYYCFPLMHSVHPKSSPCGFQGCESVDIRVFYELPIEKQIQYLFEQRDLARVIDKYAEKNANVGGKICDLSDGSEYSRVWQGVVNKYKLTLILNTDGVDPYNSSSAKLWPLMFTFMEVPPHLRSSFTIVWGIWFDKHKKPLMNLYLKPFVCALEKINRERGVPWKHPQSNEVHRSPIRAPVIIADAPARAGVLNMQEHQGKYACNTCEQKTNKLPAPPVVEGQRRKNRLRRFIYKEEPALFRTHERMKDQARYALRHGLTNKKGMKGETVLSDIPHIDISTCVLAEYMHSVLKGVVLQICYLWFFVQGDWYIGNFLNEINHFLCNDIHPPDYLTRLPRALLYFSYFKANELRALLLYYSPVIASRYMSEKYVQHWLLLVAAIFLLLQESISEYDLLTAEAMLRLFVRDVGALYGDKYYTYNIHQLTHLVLYVRRWGPLWSTSAFQFESFNGVLSKMIHGSKNEGKELVNQIFLAQGVQMLRNVVNYGKYESSYIGGIKTLGRHLSDRCLTPAESICLKDLDTRKVSLFGRVSVGREFYSSEEYDKDKKRNNSWVSCTHEGQKYFGRIRVFCKLENRVLCFVSVLKVVHSKIFFHKASLIRLKHIIPVEPTEEIICCDVLDIDQKLIQVGSFLCLRPNVVERNL